MLCVWWNVVAVSENEPADVAAAAISEMSDDDGDGEEEDEDSEADGADEVDDAVRERVKSALGDAAAHSDVEVISLTVCQCQLLILILLSDVITELQTLSWSACMYSFMSTRLTWSLQMWRVQVRSVFPHKPVA